jgi:hypothetical protein
MIVNRHDVVVLRLFRVRVRARIVSHRKQLFQQLHEWNEIQIIWSSDFDFEFFLFFQKRPRAYVTTIQYGIGVTYVQCRDR